MTIILLLVSCVIIYAVVQNDRARQYKIDLIKSEFHNLTTRANLEATISISDDLKSTKIIVENFSHGMSLELNKKYPGSGISIFTNKTNLNTFPVAFIFSAKLTSQDAKKWVDVLRSSILNELNLYKQNKHFFTDEVLFNAEYDRYIPYQYKY